MNIEIANRLVELRKKRGFSQEALAEKLGISRQAVSKWERAESSPDTSNLITLAKLYNVSLDELLATDQEKFESGAPIYKEDISDSAVEKKEPDYDYVNISWNGIHYKEGREEVHIGWRGLHIIEDGKETLRIGKGYGFDSDMGEGGIWVEGKELNHNWRVDGVLLLITLGIYLWIGFEYSLWHPGWIVFLTVPVISTFVHAIKWKNANIFAYPVLIFLGYLYFGFVEEIWHPTWLAFFTIPVYYFLAGKITEKENDF